MTLRRPWHGFQWPVWLALVGAALAISSLSCGDLGDDDSSTAPFGGAAAIHGGAANSEAGRSTTAGGRGGAGGCADGEPELVVTWQRLQSTAPPSPRSLHAMAASDAGLLLFGGLSEGLPLDDTWSLGADLPEPWLKLSSEPAARAGHAMASTGRSVLLFGGIGVDGFLTDTWEYGSEWTSPCGDACDPQPSGRSGHRMVFAEAQSSVLLFGGTDGQPKADTWAWTDGGWQLLCDDTVTDEKTTCGPPARLDHGMVYDSASEHVLLFGGSDGKSELGDLWSFTDAAWQPLEAPPGESPGPRAGHAMAFDAHTGLTLVVGGRRDGGDLDASVWGYSSDRAVWIHGRTQGTAPRPRAHATLTADRVSGKLIFVAGRSDRALDDAWTLSTELFRPECDGATGSGGDVGVGGGGSDQGGAGAAAGAGAAGPTPPESGACRELWNCCVELDSERREPCQATALTNELPICDSLRGACAALQGDPKAPVACVELGNCCAGLTGSLKNACIALLAPNDAPACDEFLSGGYCSRSPDSLP